MEQSEDLLNYMKAIDAGILYRLNKGPEQILMIPSDSYERLMKQLEQEEKYELCSILLSLKPKVSRLTVVEFLAMYNKMHTSILMTQLRYILDLLKTQKKNHDSKL
jgi:hypothetical protein